MPTGQDSSGGGGGGPRPTGERWLSDRIAALFTRRVFLVVMGIYGGLYLALTRAESLIKEDMGVNKLRLIDGKLTYTPTELGFFLTQLGDAGRDSYRLYLALEAPFAVISSLLFSFVLGSLAKALAVAETELDDAIERRHLATGTPPPKRRAKPHLNEARAVLLYVLPVLVALVDVGENVVLVGLSYDHAEVTAAARRFDSIWQASPLGSRAGLVAWAALLAGHVTHAKWMAMRTAAAVSALSMLSGWLRVAVHRLYSGEPIFGGQKPVMAKVVSKPKGLSRGSELAAADARGGETLGRVNNKKKKRRHFE
ncbi:hypothetical protein HK105_201501 [Polyrhizophydium stewartii]|uniref:Uncharacterized protein n=1 Tax=Polyrhizophydium stewartii TaxID=2732419 RepID=A0ABR4NGK4_9FUNG